jgi:ABC-2 type transport system ATP-binding protein
VKRTSGAASVKSSTTSGGTPSAPARKTPARRPSAARTTPDPVVEQTEAKPSETKAASKVVETKPAEAKLADSKVVPKSRTVVRKPVAQPKTVEKPKLVEKPKPVEKPKSVGKPSLVETPKPVEKPKSTEVVLSIEGLVKRFGDTVAVAGIDLSVTAGSFYGLVGPNGAGKTTTLSMVTGLLRPDAGRVIVHGVDVWGDPVVAKRSMGVLPDRLRLFDRLTGAQLLYYAGTLRGLDADTVRDRTVDLASAFGFEDALNRLVTDYSAGMSKKIALAAAMIHSPRLLVLDEPFESVDPVSAANITELLRKYVEAGGTVIVSSHSMDLIQRICDHVAVVVHGAILDSGTMDEVCKGNTLEERFVELAGGRTSAEGMEWLNSFSD